MPLIVFEGVDGAGKGTQIDLLVEKIKAVGQGDRIVQFYMPGTAGVLERKLRELMSSTKGIDPLTRTFLMGADYSQCMKDNIIPALEENKIVICDRSTFSSWAYQGAGHGVDQYLLELISEAGARDHWPNLTILLDLPIEKWESRKKADDPDKDIESSDLEFITRVRDGYLERLSLYRDAHVCEINADQPVEAVHSEIWSAVVSNGLLN